MTDKPKGKHAHRGKRIAPKPSRKAPKRLTRTEISRMVGALFIVLGLGVGGYTYWESTKIETPKAAPLKPPPVTDFYEEDPEPLGEMQDPSTLMKGGFRIQDLGVDLRVVEVGTTNGALVIPESLFEAGRWEGSAKLGDAKGTTVLTSHISWKKEKGPLWNMHALKPGALATVKDKAGNVQEFKLVAVKNYRKQDLPKNIWKKTTKRQIYMVTCGGDFITNADGTQVYEDNTVAVFVPLNTEDKAPTS